MENYKIVLDALAEKIKQQEIDLYIKDLKIDALKKQLEEAEKHKKAKTLEIR